MNASIEGLADRVDGCGRRAVLRQGIALLSPVPTQFGVNASEEALCVLFFPTC